MSNHAPQSSPIAEPEFSFSAADFERVRRLIQARAGICLHEGKQAMVYGRLARRLRQTRQPSFGHYLQLLEQTPGDGGEWPEFVNALTTHLTAFFREPHHFQALAQDLRARAGRPLRLWSSATSTGEEAYSILMTAHEALGPEAPVALLATDIDTRVLQAARRGVYAADAAGLDAQRLRRHFLRGTGANAGRVRLRDALVRGVRFRAFNLMAPDWSPLGGPFDIVFCRNAMIYFDAATRHRLLQRMHRVLAPGGLLYVGHAEHLSDARDLFRLRGATIYERV